MKSPKQLKHLRTGLAGEYFVSGKMNIKGWDACMTLKNYPMVDILGYNGEKYAHVQVKSAYEKSFLVGFNHSKRSEMDSDVKGPYVFVWFDKEDTPRYYILSKTQFIFLVNATDDIYYNKKKNKSVDYPMAVGLKDLCPYENQWGNLWLD